MPSMEAMLMTLAGRSGEAAARSGFASALVRKNSDLTLRFMTLSQPLSGNSSNSAPHAAPALLTRIAAVAAAVSTISALRLISAGVGFSEGERPRRSRGDFLGPHC